MLARLRYEIRAVGWGNLTLPFVVAAIFVGFSLLAAFDVTKGWNWQSAVTHDYLAQGLLYLLEFGLPPVAGLAAAYLIDNNPAKELHLSLPASYAGTMVRRLAILTVWGALICGAGTAAAQASGYWIAPQRTLDSHLTWLAPLLWFVMGGAMLSLLLRSRVASSAILGMLWIAELIFRWYFLQDTVLRRFYAFLTLATLEHGPAPNASYWLSNRLTLLAMAGVFFITLLILLRQNEALLGQEG
jgi:hypothetical protein